MERSRVAYVISLLSGSAREWGTAVWEAEEPECYDFTLFSARMKKVFDWLALGTEVTCRLLYIRQGARSVSDYSIEFRTLAATAD